MDRQIERRENPDWLFCLTHLADQLLIILQRHVTETRSCSEKDTNTHTHGLVWTVTTVTASHSNRGRS